LAQQKSPAVFRRQNCDLEDFYLCRSNFYYLKFAVPYSRGHRKLCGIQFFAAKQLTDHTKNRSYYYLLGVAWHFGFGHSFSSYLSKTPQASLTPLFSR